MPVVVNTSLFSYHMSKYGIISMGLVGETGRARLIASGLKLQEMILDCKIFPRSICAYITPQ